MKEEQIIYFEFEEYLKYCENYKRDIMDSAIYWGGFSSIPAHIRDECNIPIESKKPYCVIFKR